MKLYLIRHGETDANRVLQQSDLAGPTHTEPITFREGDGTDMALNVNGRAQAAAAAKDLPEQIRRIYTSSLLRTKETAEIVATAKGMNTSEIVLRPELVE